MAALSGLAPASWAAGPADLCGSSPELSAILRQFHQSNTSNIDAAQARRLSVSGGLGDRIQSDLMILEDMGDLVVNGVTDTTEIVNRAIRLAGDRFDFVTILTASAFPGDVSPETGFAFFQLVNNDVQGVGLPQVQDPNLTILRGFINMNDLDEYPSGPNAALPEPFFNGVVTGIEVLGHEAGHWVEAYITSTAAPLNDSLGSHWNFFMNTQGSVLLGNLWTDNGDGTFTTAPGPSQFDTYGQLDLYLWGLLPPSAVTEPVFVITNPTENPGQGRDSLPRGGFTTAGTRVDLALGDIVSTNGPRAPAYPEAPDRFTMAFVLVAPFGEQPSSTDLSLATQFRTEWEGWFRMHTGGRGSFDTTIRDIPVGGDFEADPRAGGPAPHTVQFASHLQGSVTGLTWEFGDGGVSSSPNPTHTYQSNGAFDVGLRIEGFGGPVVVAKSRYVVVGNFTPVLPDDFEIDRGWTVDPLDTATGGRWERADPEGTFTGPVPAQPEEDHTPPPGVQCHVTGAAAGASPGANDVDGGETSLLSPLFSLEEMEHAYLSFFLWYTNDLGAEPGSDLFRVDVSNDAGASWTNVKTVASSASRWRFHEVRLPDFVAPTSQMQVKFAASDLGGASLVEAAVDDVAVIALPLSDADFDGVADGADNCSGDFNPGQEDADGDGPGDACDCAPFDPVVSDRPGEVGPLRFIDETSLDWPATPEAAGYNLYRGGSSAEPPLAYDHVCLAAGLAAPGFTDAGEPGPGIMFYYLLTGANCFGEGPAGFASDGAPRPIPAPCP